MNGEILHICRKFAHQKLIESQVYDQISPLNCNTDSVALLCTCCVTRAHFHAPHTLAIRSFSNRLLANRSLAICFLAKNVGAPSWLAVGQGGINNRSRLFPPLAIRLLANRLLAALSAPHRRHQRFHFRLLIGRVAHISLLRCGITMIAPKKTTNEPRAHSRTKNCHPDRSKAKWRDLRSLPLS